MAAKNIQLKNSTGSILEDVDVVTKWSLIKDKPSTFTPTAHPHSIANITGLQSALDSKAGLNSKNTWSAEQTFNNLKFNGRGFTAYDGDLGANIPYQLPLVPSGGTLALRDDIPTTATSTKEGLVKLGGSQLTSNPSINLSTSSSRYYGVRTTSNGQMVVNVPWTNTTYSLMTTSEIDSGSSNTARSISAQRLKYAIETHAPSGGGSSEWTFEATIPHSAGQYNFSMDGYSEMYLIYSNASIANLTKMEEILYGPKEAFKGVTLPGYLSSDILYVSSSDRMTLMWDPANYGGYKSHVHIYKR